MHIAEFSFSILRSPFSIDPKHSRQKRVVPLPMGNKRQLALGAAAMSDLDF
jgi:hypothetical protein